MKNYFILLTLALALALSLALSEPAHTGVDGASVRGGFFGGAGPTQAYLCNDCDSVTAKSIAIRQAPINQCSIYRNGPIATYCEVIYEQILIPVYQSREVFKFMVSTSINSQNRQTVSVVSVPVTANEYLLLDEYFDFHERLLNGLHSAYLALRDSYSGSSNASTAFTMRSSPEDSDDIDCSEHPIWYFYSLANKNLTTNRAKDFVKQELSGNQIDATYEPVLSGGGFQISNAGGGVNLNYQFIRNSLMVSTGDMHNRLVFNVHVSNHVGDPGTAIFTLTLNRLFTEIDGLSAAELFGGNSSDLTGYPISACLKKYLEDKAESTGDDSTDFGGGTGAFQDPFTGMDAWNTSDRGMYCKYSRKYRTCSTDEDGQTCTSTRISWVQPCGSSGMAMD